MNLGIIVDSASDETDKGCKKKGWYYLPLIVNIDGKQYNDGVDLDNVSFRKILTTKSIISSSCVPFGPMEDLFREVSKKFDHVIYYPLSEGLSAQNNNAKTVAKGFKNVHVITSRMMGSLIQSECDYALTLAKRGKPIEEILNTVNKRSKEILGILVPSNLDWLKRGGRISASTAALGKLLNVHPIISFDGSLHKFGKTRSLKKSFFKGFEFLKKEKKNLDNYDIFIAHSIWDEDSDYAVKMDAIIEKLKKDTNRKIAITNIPRILVLHTYINAIAVFVLPKKV